MTDDILNAEIVAWLRRIHTDLDDTLRVETPNLYLTATEDLDGKPLDSAICAHLEWRDRLDNLFERHAERHLDANVVGQDDLCSIGRWLNGPAGTRHVRLPAFTALRRLHADFHRLVGDIVRQAQAGDPEGARRRLDAPDYTDLSWQVVNAIATLARAIGR